MAYSSVILLPLLNVFVQKNHGNKSWKVDCKDNALKMTLINLLVATITVSQLSLKMTWAEVKIDLLI